MRSPLRTIRQFLSELRRRNVYRVAVTYVVVGFFVIEGADLTLTRLGLPPWTVTLVIVLVGLGLPIALVIAWAFEVTPEGVRVEEPDGSEEEVPTSPGSPRDLWVGASVLALLLLGGWWYFGGLAGTGQQTVPDTSSLDENRVAVFPFEVRGDEELEYLGESMVELLGRSIDGAGPLRTVDPKALLVQVREMAPESASYRTVGPTEARTIAAGFEAGRFLLGSVVRVGEEIRLSATWYGADGEELGTAEVTAGSEKEIQERIDALARRAITDLAGEETGHRQRLAAQTTSSADALKHYLAGQSALRQYNFEQAQRALERAVDEDPEFALAHYRLSVAAGWVGDLHTSHRAAERAVTLSKTLPDRDHRLIRAWQAWLEGRAEEAERLCRLLVNEHPSDVTAWFLLGDTRFHFGGTRGWHISEAEGPLKTAVELDPTQNEPLGHLDQIAVIERDWTRLDSLTSKLKDRLVGDWLGMSLRAVRAYLLGGGPDEEFQERLSEAKPSVLWHTGWILQSGEHIQEAREVIRPMVRPDRPDEMQAAIRVWIANLLAAQGKLKAARQELRAVAARDSAAHLVGRSLLSVLPFRPESENRQKERQRLLDRISTWNADTVPERLLPALFLSPAEAYPAARSYLLGLLRVQNRGQKSALETAARLDQMEASEFTPSGPSDFARAIRAEVDRLAGNVEEALEQLEAIRHEVNGVLVLTSVYSDARERFIRAELLAEVGRLEEALRWYRTFDGVALGELPYLAPAHFGWAEVLKELDRPEDAAAAYRRALDLWKNADPILQPKVEKARQQLAALGEDTTGVSSLKTGSR